ncbi:MAG: DNA polymerase III subunit delta [Planctomycetes bacterium]|nr:DNA polymerase III subunit delta [Planctomycetota bacterium]
MSLPEPRPIYVLHGSDAFVKQTCRQEIVSQLIGQADPQLCVSTLDGQEILDDQDDGIAKALDEVRTLPFLAPRRVMVIRDADSFVSAARETLEKFLDKPPSGGSLVLEVLSWPSNTKLYKKVASAGVAINCDSPDPAKLPAMLKQWAAKEGKKLSADAADLLAGMVGPDVASLKNELEKLIDFSAGRQELTAKDVQALVTSTAAAKDFALTNALTRQNAAEALKILQQEMTARGEEFRLIGQLRWHLQKVLRAHEMIARGVQARQALRDCRIFYGADDFLALLRRRNMQSVQNDFRRLLRCDMAMKSGTDPRAAMQDLVIALCS